jgi:uncharacterized protein involved in outer membrane biogenesis
MTDAVVPWWRTRWARGLAIGAAILGVYALLGFVAVPWWARGELERRLSEQTGRTVTVGQVRANPFLLTVTVEDLALRGARPDPLFELARLHVDFEASSVVRGAYVFREIALQRPTVRVTRGPDGAVDWARVAADIAPAEDGASEPERTDATEGPAPLWVDRFAVEAGAIVYRDETTEPAFSTELAPLSFTLRDFGTRAGDAGEHAFAAESEAGERLSWSGRLSADPWVATGSVAIRRVHLPKYRPYVSQLAPLRFSSGTAGAALHYRVALEDAGPTVEVTRAELDVDDATAHLGDASEDFLRVGALRVREGSLSLPEGRVRIATVQVDGGRFRVRVGADGRTDLDPLFGASGPPVETAPVTPNAARPPRSPPSAPVRVALGELVTRDFEIDATHATANGVVPLRARLEDATIRGARWPWSATATTGVDLNVVVGDAGRIRLRSRVGFRPLRARTGMTIDGLALSPLQPYVQSVARLAVPSGTLSVTGTVAMTFQPDPDGTFEGRAAIDDLRTVDTTAGRDFVRWRSLAIEGARVDLRPLRIGVSRVRFVGPYARILLREDGSSNVADTFASSDESTSEARAPPADASAPPLAFRVDLIRIRDGAADFADRSVTPRFGAQIRSLGGTIERLTSTAVGSGRVALEGDVDRHAPVAIRGALHPFSSARASNLSLDFRNLEMTTLTPYAARFAGHAIEQGKLNVRLEYTLRGRDLEGRNQVIIDRLSLGERVDSPEAVKLPVKLAVALLKNKDGIIEVDVPVSGSLDDPEFRVGKVVWKAVLNLMEKAVLSPFAALGGVFSARDETAAVPFLAGTATTAAAVREDISALETALADRPALVLEVEGQWSANDRRALAEARLATLLTSFAARDDAPGRHLDEDEPLEDRLLRDAYRRAFAQAGDAADTTATSTVGAPLEPRMLRAWSGQRPAKDAPPRWRSAPISELRAELRAAIAVEPSALRELAIARAEAIRNAIVRPGRVEATRVFVLEPSAGDRAGARLRLDAP